MSALSRRLRTILDNTLEIKPAIPPPTIGMEAARAEIAGPFHFFDAAWCINLDRDKARWDAMERRFRKLGIDRKVCRFSAVETPANHHIGCALSHRRIVADAKQRQLRSVLVFEDDARFSPHAAETLALSMEELNGRDWQLLYLGGHTTGDVRSVPGCRHLVIPELITCTHAIAYHHSVYDAILDAVPDNATDVALWLGAEFGIDQFYTFTLRGSRFLTRPAIAAQGWQKGDFE